MRICRYQLAAQLRACPYARRGGKANAPIVIEPDQVEST